MTDDSTVVLDVDEDGAGADLGDVSPVLSAMAAEHQRRADETDAVRARRRQATAEAIERRPPGTDAEPVDAAAQLAAFDRIRAAFGTARHRTGRPQVAFDVSVHAGLTTISAPYDYGHHWQAPGTRPPTQSIGDRPGGLMQIAGDCGPGDERVDAIAGVGFVLRSDTFGIVQVRPYITYEWRYGNHASGALSSAESEGGVELSAWRNGDGALVSSEGVRRVRLFRDRVSAGEFHHLGSDGAVSSSDIQIEFTAEPDRHYFVNAGVWLKCDQDSGITLVPTASGYGFLSARLVFVVMQRFV